MENWRTEGALRNEQEIAGKAETGLKQWVTARGLLRSLPVRAGQAQLPGGEKGREAGLLEVVSHKLSCARYKPNCAPPIK
jgi:hypothetical protein